MDPHGSTRTAGVVLHASLCLCGIGVSVQPWNRRVIGRSGDEGFIAMSLCLDHGKFSTVDNDISLNLYCFPVIPAVIKGGAVRIFSVR